MRRRVYPLLASISALAGVIAGCTAFSANDPKSSPPVADAGAPVDAVVPPTSDAETKDDASAAVDLGCDDYTKQSYDLDTDNQARWTAGVGWSLNPTATKHGGVARHWVKTGIVIRHSTVTVQMQVTVDVAVSQGAYLNVIAQYYGPTAIYQGATPLNGISLVNDESFGPGTQIRTWPNGGNSNSTFAKTYGVFDFSGEFTMKTDWTADGRIELHNPADQVDYATAPGLVAAVGQDSLSVVVGGSASGGDVKFVLTRMCVTVEP